MSAQGRKRTFDAALNDILAYQLQSVANGYHCTSTVTADLDIGGLTTFSTGDRVKRFEMFIGHFGVGFGAKAIAPKVSLGSLFLAAQFIDLLWPTFLLLGIERVRIDPGATEVVPLDCVSKD